VLGRYLTESYNLDSFTADDAAQLFVEHAIEKWSVQRISTMLATATTLAGFEYKVGDRAISWVRDRRKMTFGGRLHRRICELPERAHQFVWILRLRWIALASGPSSCLDGDRDDLARRAAGTTAARAFVMEVHERDSPRKHTLRQVVTDVLVVHRAAARPVLVLDVLLVLCGRHDTRPAALRATDPQPPCPDLVHLHEDAAAIVDELLGLPAAKDARPLADRLTDLDAAPDPHLSAAVVEAMTQRDVGPHERAAVLSLVMDMLHADSDEQEAA
jgi:hypothetical protein